MTTSTPKKYDIATGSSYNGRKLQVNLADSFNEVAFDLKNQDQNVFKDTDSVHKKHNSIQVTPEADSIKQMELLREQINSILYSANSEYLREDLNVSSTSSIDTITLLRAPTLVKAELPFDEHGVLMSSLNSYALTKTPEQITQAYVDTSLVAENTILKESNRRERARRKYQEEQINELQAKLLECQEQLAFALSTERKKSIMIEQLDKNLAAVVNGWKKQQEERLDAIFRLTREREILISSQQKQDQMLKRFEKDLAEALQAYSKEQDKIQELNIHHKNQVDFLEKEKLTMCKQISDLQTSNFLLKEENEKNAEVLLELKNNLQVHRMERDRLDKSNNHLNEQIKLVAQSYEEQLGLVQKAVDEAQNESQDLLKKYVASSHSMQKLLIEKESLTKEKDGLHVELNLLQAKFEALKTKQDSEIKTKLEEEFNQKIYEIQKQIMSTESDLRNSEKKRFNELTAKHKEEVFKLNSTYKKEIQLAKDAIARIQLQYEDRLRDSELQVAELTSLNNSCKSQIKDLLSCLNAVKKHTASILPIDDEKLLSDNRALEYSDQLSSTLRSDAQLHSPHKKNIFEHLNITENKNHHEHATPINGIQDNFQNQNVINTTNLRNQKSEHFHIAHANKRYQTPSSAKNNSHLSISDEKFDETTKHENKSQQNFSMRGYQSVDQRNLHETVLDIHPSRDVFNQLESFNENVSSNQNGQPLSVLHEDLRPIKNEEDIGRQAQLTHFIQKLLQRSPSHIPGKKEQENTEKLSSIISNQVDHLMKETPKHQPKPSSSLPLENASIYHKEKDDKRDDTVFDTKRVQEFLKTLNVSNEKFDQNTLIEILRQNSRNPTTKVNQNNKEGLRLNKKLPKVYKNKDTSKKSKIKLKESDDTGHLKKDDKRSKTAIWK